MEISAGIATPASYSLTDTALDLEGQQTFKHQSRYTNTESMHVAETFINANLPQIPKFN